MPEKFPFSAHLIEETKALFKEEDDLDISTDTAIEYLHSFAGLFLALAEYEKPRTAD